MNHRLRYLAIAVIGVAIGLSLVALVNQLVNPGHSREVQELIARNIEARGGADAWTAIESLRLSGQLDLGQDMHVPYTVVQKRPDRMCLDFEFGGETATQCIDGDSGWKLLPFRNRPYPEVMTEEEYRSLAGSASIEGLLFGSEDKGYDVDIVGREMLNGREVIKLEIRMPGETMRWLYLDAETALETRMEFTRFLRGKDQLVATDYSDWQETDGLWIARRQDTGNVGSGQTNFVTVERVEINPSIDDARFQMPQGAVADASGLRR
jgi:hypothetical protein